MSAFWANFEPLKELAHLVQKAPFDFEVEYIVLHKVQYVY